MRFPLSVIDPEDYINKVATQLQDPSCRIFFDTNLFSQLYKSNAGARQEFYAWIDEQIQKNRVRIASWSIHEYTSQFVANRLTEYLGEIKKLSTIRKDIKHVQNFLKMYIDESTLKGTAYTSKESYFTDLDEIVGKIERMERATNAVQGYYLDLNTELAEKFENIVLDSDVYSILTEMHSTSAARFHNRMPPGFMDDDKGNNKYGDLIIWQEILNFCKAEGATKAIYITNDGKKDLVYKPRQIMTSGRKQENKEFSIVDPRLVFEFKQYTRSEDFHIIDFATMVKILWSIDSAKFVKLSAAIQLTNLEEKKKEAATVEEELPATGTVDPDSDETINELTTATTTSTTATTTAVPYEEENGGYEPASLADQHYDLTQKNRGVQILLKLKSYSWYPQNDAIQMVKDFQSMAHEQVLELKNYFFVLGRNIYQAACGGAFSAQEYIMYLGANTPKLNPFFREHLVNGMFYEIYFNSTGKLRFPKFKTGYIEQVFHLQVLSEYASSVSFIRKALAPYKECLLVLPNEAPEKAQIKLRFAITFDPMYTHAHKCRVLGLEAGDYNLLTENGTEFYYAEELTGAQIKTDLKQKLAIPESQMDLVFDPQLPSDMACHFFLSDKQIERRRLPSEL